jgi:hypothetical protein
MSEPAERLHNSAEQRPAPASRGAAVASLVGYAVILLALGALTFLGAKQEKSVPDSPARDNAASVVQVEPTAPSERVTCGGGSNMASGC